MKLQNIAEYLDKMRRKIFLNYETSNGAFPTGEAGSRAASKSGIQIGAQTVLTRAGQLPGS